MSLQSTDFTACFWLVWFGKLLPCLPWQLRVLGQWRVIIALPHKWNLKTSPDLGFPCLGLEWEGMLPVGWCLPVACPRRRQGWARGSMGGAPQSRWASRGSPCSVSALQLSCSEMWKRGGKCCALWVPGYLTKLGGRGGGSWIQVSGSLSLLSYPLMPLPSFLAAISHGILFSPPFRLCRSTREPLL